MRCSRSADAGDDGGTGECLQGLALARCTITVTGSLENCRMLQVPPNFTSAVFLELLEKQRYAPVLSNGRPIAVDYVIPIRLVPKGCDCSTPRSDAGSG